jgi:hypothetical protein
MPNVTKQTFDLAANQAKNSALLTSLNSTGLTGCKLMIFTTTGAIAAEFELSSGSGSVDIDGRLIFSIIDSEATIQIGGLAQYAEVRRADNSVFCSIPITKASVPVAGFLTLVSTTLITGAKINIASFEAN